MKAVLIQNEAGVPAGRLLEALDHLNWEAEIIRMDEGGQVPLSLDGYDCLVILGGAMNVDDTHCHPYMENLRCLAASAFDTGFPVLGLCLGAQVMARAAGAVVHKNKCGETGWHSIVFTGEGLRDQVLQGLTSPLEVFHWHDDMFELPENAALLAESVQCPHQIMRIDRYSYGFQFHPEVTADIILEWLEKYNDEVEDKLGPGGAGRLASMTKQKMRLYHNNCRSIFINYFNNITKQK